MKKEGNLTVVLVYTKTRQWEVAEYYDADSDYFDESWGASNISGYTCKSETTVEENFIHIPFHCLLQTEEQMEQSIKEFVKRKQVEQEEAEKKERILRLEKELSELKGSGK